MALLTPMSLAEAQAIGARAGLAVRDLVPVPQGSVNSNFVLELDVAGGGGGRAFLRVYEESDAAAVAEQERLLHQLCAAGVPTPAPLAPADTHRGKPAVLFPYCPGAWICQARVDPARAAQIGEALAAIHAAPAAAPANRFDDAALRARLAGLPPLPPEVARDAALLAARLAELGGRPIAGPRCVIHGDVFRDNVLWQERALSALLDFESASLGDAPFDLMVTVLAWCFGEHLEQPLARALARGYRARRALSAAEQRACFDAARAAAVRFAITRITDYELRPRGVVVYKDYRRFMARLAAVEAIGESAFADWLFG